MQFSHGPNGYPVVRATPGSAGLDIRSAADYNIQPKHQQVVKTEVKSKFPSDMYLRVAPRSGLAVKNGINVLAGVVDSDYEGEINVVLINHGDQPFEVTKGMRIAQLIPTALAKYDIIGTIEESQAMRGEGGFGSTNV